MATVRQEAWARETAPGLERQSADHTAHVSHSHTHNHTHNCSHTQPQTLHTTCPQRSEEAVNTTSNYSFQPVRENNTHIEITQSAQLHDSFQPVMDNNTHITHMQSTRPTTVLNQI